MKLLIGGYEFERRADGYWRRSSKADHSTTAEILVDWRAAALDRVAELEPLARFGRAVAEAWQDVHDCYDDIPGGIIQEAAEEAGLMVDVPAGTHEDCDACEGGAVPCKELRLP